MAKLKIGRMVLGICQTNCYFVYEEGKTEVLIFDPADKGDVIYEGLKSKGFTIAGILLTHGHFDHIWGANRLRELTGSKVYACEKEKELCEDAVLNVSSEAGRPCRVAADCYVLDNEEITIAGITCRLIATPGHTAGGCCYYFETDKLLICGDTLFNESVGRTDLPTGSMGTLIRSIKDRLMVLPDDVAAFPGHGESTTIGYEKLNNPFL